MRPFKLGLERQTLSANLAERLGVSGAADLIEQYRQIHAAGPYGESSAKNLRFLRPEIALLKPGSIIDYGCGQSRFLDELRLSHDVDLIRYDPAIPQFSQKPNIRADLLINIDVLEHIEEGDLDDVIDDLASLSRNAIIIIDTKPASTFLPDGRNAHVTIRPHLWWRQRLLKHFPTLHPVVTVRRSRAGFKTWSRSSVDLLNYLRLRVEEDLRHYSHRALRSFKRRGGDGSVERP
jgi:Methyltransferase domain